MNALVIGGCGFVGSVLSKRLLDLGNDVNVFDNLKFGFYKNIENIGVNFIEGDILYPKVLEDILPRIDIVYFLATVNIIAAEEDYDNCINSSVKQ